MARRGLRPLSHLVIDPFPLSLSPFVFSHANSPFYFSHLIPVHLALSLFVFFLSRPFLPSSFCRVPLHAQPARALELIGSVVCSSQDNHLERIERLS